MEAIRIHELRLQRIREELEFYRIFLGTIAYRIKTESKEKSINHNTIKYLQEQYGVLTHLVTDAILKLYGTNFEQIEPHTFICDSGMVRLSGAFRYTRRLPT